MHHTCKSATRALWYIKCSLNRSRPRLESSCRQASLATGVSKDGRHLQGELQYGMLPSPQDWPELYSWWDESTSRAHEWDGECIPSTGTGAGFGGMPSLVGPTSSYPWRFLLHFLAGLDIFRRGWVLCARVGHEECTLCPGLCTLNSFGFGVSAG